MGSVYYTLDLFKKNNIHRKLIEVAFELQIFL